MLQNIFKTVHLSNLNLIFDSVYLPLISSFFEKTSFYPEMNLANLSGVVSDLGKFPHELPSGYSALAATMSEHPPLGTFQSFEFLATLNLLYYQAQLTKYE